MASEHVISRLDAFAYRYPIERPVETSFGRMTDRPAVFLRVEANDGCFGCGEVFANWPAAGPEHRVNLLARDIAPLVLGRSIRMPSDFFDALTRRTRLWALQSGEWGPFRQVIAGLDTALWDLKARAAKLPLRRLLRADAPDEVPAYASGIPIMTAGEHVKVARAAGFSAFKVKVGFDMAQDLRQLETLSQDIRPDERLFADANQAFGVDEAKRFLKATAGMGLGWLEEPIPADAPPDDWSDVAAMATTPLAAGENIAGDEAFAQLIDSGPFHFIQPDLAKWGGVTGCYRVAQAALAAGRVYCPHFLGGGIGLAASAEVLAAAGGDGLLEVDVNPNPLRTAFAFPGLNAQGRWPAVTGVGLGIDRIPERLTDYVTHSACMTA